MLKNKTSVAIIFGGMSTEHDVSLMSGRSIINNIDKERYEVKPIYIDKEGLVYRYENELERIDNLEKKNLIKERNLMDAIENIDIAFPVLHGLYGEDGCIQGIFEIMKKPYVGCGVLASSICMDKVFTKEIIKNANIKQAKYVWMKKESDKYRYSFENEDEGKEKIEKVCDFIVEKIKFPMFIKPSNAGSSIGISKAESFEELKKGIEYSTKFDKKVIVEEGIDGRELECGVLGNEEIIASSVGEIIPADNFYSYSAKYENAESKTIIPVKNLAKELEKKIQKSAIKAFKKIDGKGLARVDFFIEKGSNDIILNEINTLPGFTSISMYPKLFEDVGIKYRDLITKLIEMARVNK